MTSTAAVPPPRATYRRLSVEERRAQLLLAALGLFAHRAPDEVSLDEVAVAAGVSRPLVYRYFPGGRQQLYEAALGSAAEELTLCFTEPPVGPPTERVARVLTVISASSTSTTPGSAPCCAVAAWWRPPARRRSWTGSGGRRPTRSCATSGGWADPASGPPDRGCG